MVRITADVFQIVVFATRTNALLGIGSTFQGIKGGGGVDLTQENGFELIHTSVRKEERWVVEGCTCRRLLVGMFFRLKVIDKGSADLVGGPLDISRRFVGGKDAARCHAFRESTIIAGNKR
jgi:hypothetical protein